MKIEHIRFLRAIGLAKDISVRALELSAEKAKGYMKKKLNVAWKEALGSQIEWGKKDGSGVYSKKTSKTLGQIFGDAKESNIGQKLIKGNELRKEAGLLFGFEKGSAGKTVLSGLDKSAFVDLNVDKVNLIPYSEEEYDGVSYENLDWIPFKFVDARNDKPIVFRAILSGISDAFSPEYSSERYVGRPTNVYVYQGTTRNISFTFDVYPKSDTELVTLWEKLNYLAGLTYPHLDSTGQGMISPYSKLTIGDMYRDAPGYISSLTYTVQDNGTWETTFAKLPKYIQVQCEFIYIGKHLPTAEQKHYDPKWIPILGRENFTDKAAKWLVDRGGSALGKGASFVGGAVKGFFNKDDTKAITDTAAAVGTE